MKAVIAYLFELSILLMLFNAFPSYAQPGCQCHSDQPGMKRMHEVIGFKDCANCHSKDENLMSGEEKKDGNPRQRLGIRFQTDGFCNPCHDSEGLLKKARFGADSHKPISGTLFCPKDGLSYPAGTKVCSECGGVLLNIDELMERSHTSPSNDVCLACHTMEQVKKTESHSNFREDKLAMCIDCHAGHEDCGSCHH